MSKNKKRAIFSSFERDGQGAKMNFILTLSLLFSLTSWKNE
ncbi:hypothetical protein B4133_1567 [Bacillus altitudinis]|nr:hypothetical protein B4133_1567 [Bacillus altitudinis]